MLIRSTWTLTVSAPTVLPRAYNLELVKQLHQQLGVEMGNDKIPSISYSGILGYSTTFRDFLTFHPDEFYSLSMCGLNETAAKAIASLKLSSLEFLGARFNIINHQEETASYEELYTTLVANEPEPVKRFDLRFITPTAFAQSGGVHLPIPVPTLMFRSWLEKWNNFAPVYLGSDELIAYLREAVVVRHHKIQTRTFPIHRGYVNGFIGDVTLQVLSRADPLLANIADLLVQYAQFSGTGVKTRLGMGATKIKFVNKKENEENRNT